MEGLFCPFLYRLFSFLSSFYQCAVTPSWVEIRTARCCWGGNEVLFFVTAVSYWLHIKSLYATQIPMPFVRMVYGSLLVKMLVCLVAVLFYAWLTMAVNRNAIIGCFVLYIIYTFLEVRILTQLTKKLPKNG